MHKQPVTQFSVRAVPSSALQIDSWFLFCCEVGIASGNFNWQHRLCTMLFTRAMQQVEWVLKYLILSISTAKANCLSVKSGKIVDVALLNVLA